MVAFSDVEQLKKFLREDAGRASINPVRIISVDTMKLWIEVKSYLLASVGTTLYLSHYCSKDDTTPNIGRLRAQVKKTEGSVLVVPLSEHLRIFPERAEAEIQNFISVEYQNNSNGKQRIYFLMYRMKNLLKPLSSDDPRTKNCIILLETEEKSDYDLTIVQDTLTVDLSGNKIYGYKSYLEYWEENPAQPLILYTSNAVHFEKNKFFDNVHVLVSSYDLIKYQGKLPAGVTENLGSQENWDKLAEKVFSEGSFDSACQDIFRTNKYDAAQLFGGWLKYSDFQKWLLWLWARLQSGNGYEIQCAKACASPADFVEELYCGVVEHLNDADFPKLYEERKSVLRAMKSTPTERFWGKVNSLSASPDKLSCLTCLTDVERKAIFEIISGFKYRDCNIALARLKLVYPQLYYYLHNDSQPNSAQLSMDQQQYFSEYKWLKATDSITSDFADKVSAIAREKGASVFAMQPRNTLVTSHYDDGASILFVDGMGIEYVDYLAHLCSELDEKQYGYTIEAGFCTLPSITEINKDFMDGRRTVEPPVRDLDELKHGNNIYTESLMKQLGILDELKNKVLGQLVGNIRKIIITADHGTSRMAVKVRGTEFDKVYESPEGIRIYKYGRFCEETQDESKYPTAISYNGHLVFADYSRFVQKGAPIDEIHGGASLEEWIVPVVTVEKYSAGESENVVVSPVQSEYKPAQGTKEVRVTFDISGEKRTTVCAMVKGKPYKCKLDDEGKYYFTFVPLKNDSVVKVQIKDKGHLLGQFDIQIQQGIRENDKFRI